MFYISSFPFPQWMRPVHKKSLDDFGVSDAILLGDANSSQTSIKCCDLACDVKPLPLKIVKI